MLNSTQKAPSVNISNDATIKNVRIAGVEMNRREALENHEFVTSS